MGLYLYGITSVAELADAAPELRGIDDARVRLLGDGDTRLVVSPLDRPLDDLEQGDPEAAVAAVRRHDAVLRAVATAGPVLPVRFGTVLADDAAARELLADPRRQLATALDAVAGADEWVVRIEAADPAAESTRGVDGELPPGHAFFARRRSEADARAEARARAATVADELASELEAVTRAARELPVREPGTVARIAFLVDRQDEDRFLAALDGHAGVAVAVQGPLPPYRFVTEAAQP